MPVEALDTAEVRPAAGTFSERVAPCGCRGVPDGQHVANQCGYSIGEPRLGEAPRCARCNLRGKTVSGLCPFCGQPRE